MQQAPRPQSRMALVVAAGIVATALWLRWRSLPPPLDVDVEVYARAGVDLLERQSLYDSEPGELPFTYPPFAAVLFVPLGAAGGFAPWLMLAGTLVAYVGVVVLVGRAVGLTMMVATLVGLGGLALEPTFRTLSLGQINVVLMALVLFDILRSGRAWSGVAIGVAAAVKLTPGFFILWFVIKRDVPAIVRCVAAFAVATVIGGLAAPKDWLRFWSGGASPLETVGDEQLTGANQSARAVLARLLGEPGPSWWLVLPCAVALAALASIAAHRNQQTPSLAVCSLALGALLVSPVSWTHHWVWAVPLVGVLFAIRRPVLAWSAGVVTFLAPMWFVGRNGAAALGEPLWVQALDASYAVLGVGMLGWIAMAAPGAEIGTRHSDLQPAQGTDSDRKSTGSG